jgi:nitroreductase
MELRDVIYNRRSVRDYAPQPVDESTLKALIDAAIQAPSAINEQPWSFCIIRDQGLLDRISQKARVHMMQEASSGKVPTRLREHLADPNFHIFYHAPALILISAIEAGIWAVEDCTLAAQNLMLAAYAAGLGTCWIGFAQHWLQTDEGKAVLRLPNHYLPIAPIIIGHPRSQAPAVERRPAQIRWVG